MPRNSSGTYTLPVAAFVSGTVIKSADMNSDLSDIATALTQSIATTGVSTITAPIPFTAGTAAAPGITIIGSLTTGIYSPAANQVAITCGGTQAIAFASTGVTFPTGVTFNTTSITFSGASQANAFITALAENFPLVFTIDGGGSVPTTGAKGYLEVPCNATIIRATILADQVGSASVTIAKSSYAGFPPSVSIVAAAPPTLTAAQKNQDSTLTGWTTALSAGDILGYTLSSVATCTRIQVMLLCTRTSR